MEFASDSRLVAQAQTPLVDILRTCATKPHAAFYTPGHKQGKGSPLQLVDWWGMEVLKADLPELPELGSLFPPTGAIQEAQSLAAKAFGAERTFFLHNGSTSGVMAAILATCGAGDKIILPRNIHQCAIAALVLSGAVPIFLTPEYDSMVDLAYCITPEAVENALQQHRDVKAVLLVYPTYQGICGDVVAIAKLVHQYNIPLLVDAAHGAHFAFNPDLPPSALSSGADLTVQSTHKTLGAMTQAAMLHMQGKRIAPERIEKALQLLLSTSPSHLLLASLDAARQQMALSGKELLSRTLELAYCARERLAEINDLVVIDGDSPQPGFVALDATRLTVNLTGLGLSGFTADEILHEQLGVTAELPTLQNLTFIITFGNSAADIDKLVQGLQILSQEYRGKDSIIAAPAPLSNWELGAMSPREAFFAPSKTVALEQAVGCISAELVCPYPPGIPVLMPGEVVTRRAIDYLRQVLSLGSLITIQGCRDSGLETIQVMSNE